MPILGYILLFTFIGSIGSLIGGLALLTKQKLALKISHFIASFAAGTLLGTAFFDLLPEAARAAEEAGAPIFLWTLVGIVVFFLAERFIHWFHHHEDFHDQGEESKTTIPLIIFGDTIHNFIDGMVIAATFMVSIPLGVTTALAVATHEIPQEIGDFGLLLHKKMEPKKVVLVNILSASAAFLGAAITFTIGDVLEGYIPIFLSLTAGFFIYIAASDLIPEIHHEKRQGFAFWESVFLVLGVILIYISTSLLGNGH